MKRIFRTAIFITTSTAITGCSAPIHYEEIDDPKCDHTYKIIQPSPNQYRAKNTCTTSDCFFIRGLIQLAGESVDDINRAIVQKAQFTQYRKACAKKGIIITQPPSGEIINIESQKDSAKKHSNDILEQIEVY